MKSLYIIKYATNLEQWEQVLILVLQDIPFVYKRWHQQVNILGFVEMVPDRVSQSAYCVVQDQQVLMLIFAKCIDQSL